MHPDQWHLLRTKRFLPLFLTQFLGAFNDNIFKNALVILITYSVAEDSTLSPQIMVTIAAGIFILPFFLFSTTAGQLADKYNKTRLIQIIKFIEILLMLGATIGFFLGSVNLLLLVLFLMGTQSAFFGPLKYGILPDQLHKTELIGGNALIGTGTFISILMGTILGGLLILTVDGTTIISTLVIAIALFGWLCSLYIPATQPAAPDLTLKYNIFVETSAIIQHIKRNPIVFRSILGISWFWLFGATFLSQFPTFSKNIIGGDEQVVTLFLAVFSIGIGIGSLLCNKLLKGEIAATYVPLGILGMTIFTLDLYFASGNVVNGNQGGLIGVAVFLQTLTHWRILMDLLGIAICGGIYIVPLYALIQNRTEEAYRSRTIAGNNIMNALFMVVSALGVSLMLARDFSVTEVFLTIAILNSLVAIYISSLLPEPLAKSFLRGIFHILYRLDIKGLENFQKLGDQSIIVANHLSLLDAALIGAAVPERVSFAMNTHIARQRWIKPFLLFADTLALDPTNPMSTRILIDHVKKGNKIVIFPEGRLTMTGSLMKIYEGPAMIADKSGAQILPVILSGAQYTPFSKLRGKVCIRLFPRITLTFMPPVQFNIPSHIKGRKRRHTAGIQLYDVMTNMMFQSNNLQQTLFQSVLEAKNIHGGDHIIVEDIERKPLSYDQFILRCFILGEALRKATRKQENVGIFLPNMVNTLICFFGLQVFGRIPAMLNYTASEKNLLSACQTASIRLIITSRKFIDAGKFSPLIERLKAQDITLLYLEDLRDKINGWDKLKGQLAAFIPASYYKLINQNRAAETPAVVLFTSGTEGTPKGVVLTHKNIQANRYQVLSRIDFGPTDIVFNALPMFHSFGLTSGTLLPILSGMKTFLYPSPLHYRIIPELVHETNATLLFGTDTFLAGYARYARPYDFHTVRYVFAGAEKLQERTQKIWTENFGVRIFEGYGTTETSPILSMNTPMHNQPGSVGRLMPGISYQLQAIPGIADGGRLLVSGPNIMKGYYLSDKPGVITAPTHGWYDTGDIVAIDDSGYITIKGRARRFAKIGGEMVSLMAVEDYISKLWPQDTHAVVQISDPKKGEQLVLITTHPQANRNDLLKYMQRQGISELNLPKTILMTDAIPVLGTGKTDYVALLDWVKGTSKNSEL
ncbi:MAG: acyl-[ACP]--phospholipid O-acyltransferase [Nitrosomonas sp.]|nr:acyl-[ACP]--phospholipid O-acyltransferase [Nitrosomonas sp.]MDP1950219.1 acyl-[ACP]--phospholipid O-acyltransferase [Nitrosomonas sp.]